MKRILVAVSLSVLAVPAFAVTIAPSAPYEQTQIDRLLPNVPERAIQTETQTNPFANDFSFIAPAA